MDECVKLVQAAPLASLPHTLAGPRSCLDLLDKTGDDKNRKQKQRLALLVCVEVFPLALEEGIPATAEEVRSIKGRLKKIIAGFAEAGVHILPKGELENHLPSFTGNHFHVADTEKLHVFEQERDYLLREESARPAIEARYASLLPILDAVSKPLSVNMDTAVAHVIGDWVHKVQSAVRRGEVTDEGTLRQSAAVAWGSHSRILDLIAFELTQGGFNCRIRLRQLIDPREREIAFNQGTVAANVVLPDASN